jgi:hypothetical protein
MQVVRINPHPEILPPNCKSFWFDFSRHSFYYVTYIMYIYMHSKNYIYREKSE